MFKELKAGLVRDYLYDKVFAYMGDSDSFKREDKMLAELTEIEKLASKALALETENICLQINLDKANSIIREMESI